MGIRYLTSGDVSSQTKISNHGDFANIYDLVKLSDIKRSEFIRNSILETGVKPTAIPLSDGSENIFVSNPSQSYVGKKVLFVSHYDTYLNMDGALDNTS